jgi:hypothetical protein
MNGSPLFPVFVRAYELTAGESPIMLDGMEVLFDKTVGFYPVRIEPKAVSPGGEVRNGKGGNGKPR